MGIKGLKSYLDSQPKLKHYIEFKQHDIIQQRKIIIWDVLGFMRRLFGAYDRTTKLFFDFNQLKIQTKRTIDVFKSYGFQLVAFIDGYHIEAKVETKMQRLIRKRNKIRKTIELIKKLQNDQLSAKNKDKIIRKMPFIPSSGYKQFLETTLISNGCNVYRGTGKHDIDQDIATYTYLNQDDIYGIISVDTDFFGFYNLPKHIKLINDYRTKKRQLTFTYYYSDQIWNSLRLYTKQQRFKLISITGNDFIKPKQQIKIQCAEIQSNKCSLVSESVLKIDELINIFDDIKYNEKQPLLKCIANTIVSNSNEIKFNIEDSINKFYCIRSDSLCEFKQNINTIWMDLQCNNVYESGIYVHDIDGVGFTIQDKVTHIRHLIIKQKLNLNKINEWKCRYDKENKCIIKESKIVYLGNINVDETINVATNNIIDDKYVVMTALKVLKNNNWLTMIQYNALELQFKFRYESLAIYQDVNKWPFAYTIFEQFKKFGIPRISDLTAQCLYWELCKWVCFNPNNILPNIYNLFDGPLFHFFCYVQANNDEHCVIKNLRQMLTMIAVKYREI
eukprot:342859_1